MMIRLKGILKVVAVLVLDFLAVFMLFSDLAIASVVTGVIAIYVWLGG